MKLLNYQVVFAKPPGVNGAPAEDNFRYESCEYPADPPPGHVLVQNLYLSVDPAQRCQMNESTGAEYLLPWQLGQAIPGLGGVGKVLSSNDDGFSTGDIVMSGFFEWPWKLYFTIEADKIMKVDERLVGKRLSLPISCLGLVGLTALFGITERSQLRSLPTDGSIRRTLVVSGAAGACGHIAGQIGRLEGADRVVGICGSDTKCQFLTTQAGFDAAINYRSEDVSARLAELCPDGVHSYFDNVGGPISDAVIAQMAPGSAVVLCGQISAYNTDAPYPPPLRPEVQRLVDERGIVRERFLVLEYQDRFADGVARLARWLAAGAIKVFETEEDGLENAGKAFCSMMSGGNIGKQIVKVSDA
ncbi:prostaglandin reductase 2-like [Amphibalanus amphitrite]|uniref:prostaglandin reductase 2-like n=1 Tax=Amphibalanus amphitrite TaxID=1232801 RepID=UPI001C8FAEEE|nr:prostaglandin reductase 2-like [Amphibalanus amphitrite]XP_043189505.1 prostaglandin reductase 2-like [Amphibalanus amphitrite]XP_043189506.1 prostaglandin reductase 2-like [Amphibalanus amphitrite]XP_043189507.1 prostaglandin reductase 2-like [Amphibalanus amphitrite]XP_043189510.1 prostaglandin reductase 2-like [Amphibalanus amphitrite]XP_043189511.1 prostaglandin reductase 2-like [Amphibalanus amphitrite]XP_043189512.1 prostaglandin reductase 2-like [Amphibalanus amphitrite]XP_04318951